MSGKKAVRFILRPRRQRDPLAADFEAPQYVLEPKDGTDIEEVKKKFPDLDPTIFPSTEETKIGMLERAHASGNMALDKDLMQAMSQDFDYNDPNNIIDDDFMDQAGGLIEDEGELRPEELELMDDGDFFGDDEEFIDVPRGSSSRQQIQKIDLDDDLFKDGSELDQEEDRRSEVFTNYSLTSSVMRRSRGLQQIDEHFERLYEKEYADDTEIGPLDLNEVKGQELLKNIDQIREFKREVKEVRKRNHGDDYEPEIVSEHHNTAIIGDGPGDEDEDFVEVEFRKRENRVDCESILSYNSNLYNHPKLIVEPSRRRTNSRSTVDQMDTESSRAGGKAQSIASSRASILSRLSIRPIDESSEDRRSRKKALREYRQARRQEKKQNQQIFKSEQANLMRQQINNLSALKL